MGFRFAHSLAHAMYGQNLPRTLFCLEKLHKLTKRESWCEVDFLISRICDDMNGASFWFQSKIFTLLPKNDRFFRFDRARFKFHTVNLSYYHASNLHAWTAMPPHDWEPNINHKFIREFLFSCLVCLNEFKFNCFVIILWQRQHNTAAVQTFSEWPLEWCLRVHYHSVQ